MLPHWLTLSDARADVIRPTFRSIVREHLADLTDLDEEAAVTMARGDDVNGSSDRVGQREGCDRALPDPPAAAGS
jgi:hypothetical protein